MGGNWTGQWQGKWEGRLIGPIDPNFLTGTTGFSIAASGLVHGAGILAGQAYFSLGADGNIENGTSTVPAYGTAGFTLSAAGTVIGALLASGAASIVLDAQGDAYLATNAAGVSALSVGASGNLRALGAVLGTGAVDLSAGASLSGVGSLSGTSNISVLPNGDIFSPLWASGQSGLTIGITGSINGALWASGEAPVALQAQGLLHGIGAISGAAWVALNCRYFDMSRYQRGYVTSVVESIYTQSVADQIISVAAQNNLSVLDAIHVVTAKSSVETLVVRKERTIRAPAPVRSSPPKQQPEKAAIKLPTYSVAEQSALVCAAEARSSVAFSELQSIVAESGENTVFIQHKPKRASLEQPSGGS